MTLERRRPLPAGRYWAHIFPQNRAAWDAWLKVQLAKGHAMLENTEHFDAFGDAPEHDFVVWRTTAETVWPDETMGFAPNIAEESVTSTSDVESSPKPETVDPLERMDEWGKQIATTIVTIGGVAIGLVGLVALLSMAKRRNRR